MNAIAHTAYFQLVAPECFGIAEKVLDSGKQEHIDAAMAYAGSEEGIARDLAATATTSEYCGRFLGRHSTLLPIAYFISILEREQGYE